MYRTENFGALAILLLFSVIFAYDLADAHPGRTDANGGHYNRKTGEYHYHGGGKSRTRVNSTPAVPRTEVVTRPTPVTQSVTSKVFPAV